MSEREREGGKERRQRVALGNGRKGMSIDFFRTQILKMTESQFSTN